MKADDGFPVPPPKLRVAVSGIADPADHLDAGRRSARAIESLLERNELEASDLRSILDFGCGSGRVTRQWAPLTETDVHGCDYNGDAIAWCQANLTFATWRVNRLAPPLPYRDEQFQLIYALSVFTHFAHELQTAWMEEMRRVLSTDGHLLFTTMGDTFRSHLAEDELVEFDDGNLIVHFPQSAGSNMCAAYHPRAYVERLLRETGMMLVDEIPDGDDSPFPQDMWLARKGG